MNSRKLGLVDINWILLAIVAIIATLGVYNLHSAAQSKDPTLYLTQLAWFGVGGLGVIIIMIPDYRLSENMAYFIYGVVCLLLVAVLLGGEMAGGARRWLKIGPIKFQPSELAKIATILCLARYFSSRVPERGYSLIRLFRPMNVSRPIASMGLFCAGTSPGLPIPSVLARSVHGQLVGEAIIMGDSLWMRVGLWESFSLSLSWPSLAWCDLPAEQALLNPWPPGRKKKLIGLIVVTALAAVGGVVLNWDSAILKRSRCQRAFLSQRSSGPGRGV